MRRWAIAAATAGAVLVLPVGALALPNDASPADASFAFEGSSTSM
jgi:hypothetical protein